MASAVTGGLLLGTPCGVQQASSRAPAFRAFTRATQPRCRPGGRDGTRCQAMPKPAPRRYETPAHIVPTNKIRKFFLQKEWDLQWVDSIARDLFVVRDPDILEKTEEVIQYLLSVGIKNRDIENMAASCRHLLRVPAADMAAVVEHLRAQGIEGPLLDHLLVRHPQLLMYQPGPGPLLVRGKARARVEIEPPLEDGKRECIKLHVWRDGAAFDTAPIAPLDPLVGVSLESEDDEETVVEEAVVAEEQAEPTEEP